ncbi:unnamed protein product [Cladocopium goreaui]|uniref:Copia protein n=1 Tax=Cladocopium goreaui TaxID=2562237 RepID=A0A9P1FTA6_9DINO|nr:unnamed protein product [Cladocopium goreaui]
MPVAIFAYAHAESSEETAAVGKAPLSAKYEAVTGLGAIRIGLDYGLRCPKTKLPVLKATGIVELKREDANGKVREITKNVLTCVDLATDFAQQIIVEPGDLADVHEQHNPVSQSQILADPSFEARVKLRDEAARALVWVSWNGALYRCSPEGLRPLPEDEVQFRELSQKLSAGCLHDDVERAEETLDKRWGQYVDLVPDLPTADDMELSQDVEQEPDYVNPAPETEGGPRKVRRRFYRSQQYWEDRAAGRIGPHGALHEGELPTLINLEGGVANQSDESPAKHRRISIEDLEPPVPELSLESPGSYTPSIMDDVVQPMSPNALSPDTPAELQPDAAAEQLSDSAEGENTAMSDGNAGLSVPELPDVVMSPEEVNRPVEVPVPNDDDELAVQHQSTECPKHVQEVFEMSVDIVPDDITDNPLCLWSVLEDCFTVNVPKAKQRRVEVSFRKLTQGGGTPEMDKTLEALKKKLPFGDYRTYTIRYTGAEIRQNPQTMEIEVGVSPKAFRSQTPKDPVASSSHDDGPLNQQEISLMSGLLHRAIKFKQTSLVLAAYQMSNAPKSNYVLHRALLQQCEEMTGEDQGSVAGSMTDATKRLREVEEAEDDGTSSWNVFHYGDNYPHSGNQPAPSYVGSQEYTVPTPYMQTQTMPQMPTINGKIPLPKGLGEIAWGKSLCKLDQVKEWSPNGRSYVGLMEDAKKSSEICTYLKWIKKTFGTGGTGIIKKKITPAVDLALYLERMGWMEEEPDAPFVREFVD